MKIKRFLLSSAVLSAIAFVLRITQYFTSIDKNGYFILHSSLQKAVSYSIYAVTALAVIFALAVNFSKEKTTAVYSDVVGGKTTGVMLIICAIITMLTSGVFFTSVTYDFTFPINIEQIPDVITIITAVLGIFASLHLAFSGLSVLSGNKWSAARTLCAFTPVYFALYGIYEFYTTFDSAGQSGTKLFMLSVCVIALFWASIALSHTNSEIYTTRVAALSGVLTVIGAITGPAYAVAMLVGKAQFTAVYFAQSLLHTAMMIIAFCVLVRISFIKPKEDDGEIEPIEFSPLDKYLNEIPDEDRGSDE